MKKLPIFTILLILLFLTSCHFDGFPIYYINNEYEVSDGVIESLYIEKDSERFVWTRIANERDWCEFHFSFSNNLDLEITNSIEFSYMFSTGESIQFSKTESQTVEWYEFRGSISIYIYYNNASHDIKTIIDSDYYSICTGFNTWESHSADYFSSLHNGLNSDFS